jgi:CMP-N,N'-diacetyllegionaminic acid synthase
MILGTICCRGGSKGVRGKNIRLLNGKPLIAYTIEIARSCTMLDDVIVSTDNEEIANIAIEYGAKVPFIRPASLATDEASKWPVFLHAVEKYEEQFGREVSYIADMDVTVPLKMAIDIDGAIKMALRNPETDVVITGYTPEKNPYFNMMEVNKRGYAEIVAKSEEPIVRRQDAPKVFSLSGAAFVVKKSALYNYSHWSQAVCRVYEMPRERALDIDEEIDFELIELLLNRRNAL